MISCECSRHPLHFFSSLETLEKYHSVNHLFFILQEYFATTALLLCYPLDLASKPSKELRL